jgi:hypothetical protein
MATEFDAIFNEFSDELDALAEMADAPAAFGREGVTARERIAAGNAATLLLAAIFEEYIRQQVRATFRAKTRNARDMTDFPRKIAATVWRQSLEVLARTPFEEIESDGSKTEFRVATTLRFCLHKNITEDVGDILAHNANNMRHGELGRLFNQIGLGNIVSSVCEEQDLIDLLGAENASEARDLFVARSDEFFRRRNEIAHAIKLGSSSGPSALHQDIELFRVFGRALSAALQQRLMEMAGVPEDVAALRT